MKIIIVLLCCVLGFMWSYLYGTHWIYQYQIQGQARWTEDGWQTYRLFIKPRVFPPVGLPDFTRTILELRPDGYWYSQMGIHELKFKWIEN